MLVFSADLAKVFALFVLARFPSEPGEPSQEPAYR
jgi:hypothetical protein